MQTKAKGEAEIRGSAIVNRRGTTSPKAPPKHPEREDVLCFSFLLFIRFLIGELRENGVN
jgi:hypothetical protein